MNYQKPIALFNEELSEGVFAFSGSQPVNDCYTVTSRNHQTPEMGRGDFRFQVDANHNAVDGHHSTEQILAILFNMPVQYKSSNGVLVSENGTSIAIKYNYHNNAGDNIGLGDIVVTADPGVMIIDMALSCNHQCGQHSW